MRRNRKNTILLGLIILFLGLGIGYSFITTTLTIDGTANVDSNTWNVYWDNVRVAAGSVTGDQVTSSPTIDTNKTTVSFRINLKEPGEYYEFKVDAKNDGTLDAMIDTISKSTIPAYINYSVTYDNDIEINEKDLFSAGDKKTYKIVVKFRDDVAANELPSSPQSVQVSFAITYVQADNSATEVDDSFVYTFTDASYAIGNNVPSDGIYNFYNYQDVTNTFNHPFFMKHKVVNNKVVESYVGFVLNGYDYYLQGSATAHQDIDNPYYAKNSEILRKIFGNDNCVIGLSYNDKEEMTCSSDNLSVYIEEKDYYKISVNDGDFGCRFISEGSSTCGLGIM